MVHHSAAHNTFLWLYVSHVRDIIKLIIIGVDV